MGSSNAADEASNGKRVSRSGSEPDSASLREVEVANPPDRMKPAISGRDNESTRWTSRGGWGRRARKEWSRNLGGPAGREAERVFQRQGECITRNGPGRESDRLIVAEKRLTTVERRGLAGVVLL